MSREHKRTLIAIGLLLSILFGISLIIGVTEICLNFPEVAVIIVVVIVVILALIFIGFLCICIWSCLLEWADSILSEIESKKLAKKYDKCNGV